MDLLTSTVRALNPFPSSLPLGAAALYFVLSAVAYLAYLVYIHRDGSALGCSPRPDLEAIPGGVPLLGNLIDSIRYCERQLEWWTRIRKNQRDKSKSLTASFPGGYRVVDVRNDPDAVQYILKDHFTNFVKGLFALQIGGDLFGRGIFLVDGGAWKAERQAMSKIFTKFTTVISAAILEDLDKLVKTFQYNSESGKSLDLAALFMAFTLSSFSKMAFGVDVDCLGDAGAKPSAFAQAFDDCQHTTATRLTNPFFWRVFELFSAEGKALRSGLKIVDSAAYKIIDERLADREANSNIKREAHDLLDLYMAARSESGHVLDRKQLRDAVLNLIIAGRDTTAQTLSWVYFHLLSQPRYLHLLREDADALFEKDGKIDFDNFRELKFTEAVFNEMHPPVAHSVRSAVKDDILPNGTRVDAGDMVRWSNWEIGRDEGVWGPDAKCFKPERWIKEVHGEKHVMNVGQFKGNWFHGGPRLCLGQNMATYESLLVLSTLVRSFDIKFAEGYVEHIAKTDVDDAVPTPRYANALTLPFLEPFMVTVSRRGGGCRS